MAPTLEELAARVEALERAQTATPVSYYTSRYSGEEMDERLDTVGVLGGSTQQALANLGAGVRPGLGINMDFSINQRGQSRYTANGYTVDGWKAQLTNLTSGSVEFKSPGITITASGGSNGYLDIMQYLEEPLFGRTLTFSVLYEDGTFLTITGTAPSETPSSNTTFANQMYDKGGIWLRMATTGKVYMQIRTQAGCSTSPVYAKPEEGSDQTLAYKDESGVWHLLPQPDADYRAQLRKCQRFLVILTEPQRFIGICTIDSIYGGQGIIFTPVPMRAAPVVSGNLNLFGFGNNTQITPSVMGSGPTGVRINFTAQNLVSVPCMALLYNTNPDNPLILSAEL